MPCHCRFLNPRLKNVMCKSEFLALVQLFSNFFDGYFQKPPIGRMKNRYAKTLFFLWHPAHIRGCPFQKVSYDLIELRGVLGGDDGNACAFLVPRRAIPAASPPLRATAMFSENVLGAFCLEISVVVASASIFSTSSSVVMLSRRFSFFNPFRFLYWRVDIPDHAREISSVRMAYSTPFCTPRTWMACSRWLILSRV